MWNVLKHAIERVSGHEIEEKINHHRDEKEQRNHLKEALDNVVKQNQPRLAEKARLSCCDSMDKQCALLPHAA
jgi:hypothetical protein